MNPIERLRLIGHKFRKGSPSVPIEEVPVKEAPVSKDDWILGEATGFHYLKLLTPDEAKERGMELDAPALILPEDEFGSAENPVFFRREGILKVNNYNPNKEEGIYFNRGPIERGALDTTEDMESRVRLAKATSRLHRTGVALYWPDPLSHWEALIEPTGQTVMNEIDGYTTEARLVGVKSFCAVDRRDLTTGVVVSMEGHHFPICSLEEHPEFDGWTLYPFEINDGEVSFFKSVDQIAKDSNPDSGEAYPS